MGDDLTVSRSNAMSLGARLGGGVSGREKATVLVPWLLRRLSKSLSACCCCGCPPNGPDKEARQLTGLCCCTVYSGTPTFIPHVF